MNKHISYKVYKQLVGYNVSVTEWVKFNWLSDNNLWDEEWEIGGINTIGQDDPYVTNSIRSKNYIPCLPKEAYFFKTPKTLTLCFYDSDKQWISTSYPRNVSVTSPNNARYIRFSPTNYGTTYNNDIAIYRLTP